MSAPHAIERETKTARLYHWDCNVIVVVSWKASSVQITLEKTIYHRNVAT